MAIISCPECAKKISSRAPICSYCGFHLGEVTTEDLQVFEARRLRDRIYHLNMVSYLVITVFVAAFGWYWWDTGGFVQASSIGPFVLMGVSALCYLAVRALLFRARQQRKKMRERPLKSMDLRRNL